MADNANQGTFLRETASDPPTLTCSSPLFFSSKKTAARRETMRSALDLSAAARPRGDSEEKSRRLSDMAVTRRIISLEEIFNCGK